MVAVGDLKFPVRMHVWVRVPPRAQVKTASAVFSLWREHMNCFMCVWTRKAELYFSSKKNERAGVAEIHE